MISPRQIFPATVRLALESLFLGPGFEASPVSVKAGIRDVRAAVPDCKLSDEALGTVVAQYAIERGYHVDLDGDGKISSRI
ncbi:MAG: hypothetical protein H0T56_11965 [Pseudaminobacter sp.]|nr:hypothetical protein [Pseudaminobacter sp.]